VKLSKLIDELLSEAERSPAAIEAERLGLQYIGRGRFIDPKTRKVVAKSINQTLVKVDPSDNPEPATQSNSPEAPVTASPAPATEPEEFSSDAEPEEKQVVPAHSTALERMLAAAGGDSMKVRKALVKKFREGNANAQSWIDQLDQHDEAQKADIQKSIAAVQQRKDQELAARKAKYMNRYPSPQI
jgi:hypothetical protein